MQQFIDWHIRDIYNQGHKTIIIAGIMSFSMRLYFLHSMETTGNR